MVPTQIIGAKVGLAERTPNNDPLWRFLAAQVIARSILVARGRNSKREKVIKIRKSFVALNFLWPRGLPQKNFRAPHVTRYDLLSRGFASRLTGRYDQVTRNAQRSVFHAFNKPPLTAHKNHTPHYIAKT